MDILVDFKKEIQKLLLFKSLIFLTWSAKQQLARTRRSSMRATTRETRAQTRSSGRTSLRRTRRMAAMQPSVWITFATAGIAGVVSNGV